MNIFDPNKKRIPMLLIFLFTLMMILTSLTGCHTSTKDGEIISKELLDVSGQNPKINIYKLFYYSDGTKVEAILTEPKSSGNYPLLVYLHGGLAFEHKSEFNYNFGYTVDQVKTQSSQVIALYPEYRGYLESSGFVQGLAGNTLDAQNAIKATMSIESAKLKTDSLYLLGYSLGGGIALKMASERHDVKAIVAVSPYVGSDEYMQWLEKNPGYTSEVINLYKANINDLKNDMLNSNNSLLNRIPDIQAPVLFLQGTADLNVVWQTVQEFADDMKKANKTVKIILYPNGQHSLNDQYEQQRDQEIKQWFQNYGFPKSWG